jgi:hypothetical protein
MTALLDIDLLVTSANTTSDIFIHFLPHRFLIPNTTFEGHCGILCIIALINTSYYAAMYLPALKFI